MLTVIPLLTDDQSAHDAKHEVLPASSEHKWTFPTTIWLTGTLLPVRQALANVREGLSESL